ncbi:DUF6415 family natural product biosynthesis protein [Streptomyces sp. NPDC048595]|uniref:DUF6415 family natural product biosynthesis protein n=1 Tax=Streptomyces sp. NPDC048595 TaxID=3365576 RepID=UPI003721C2A9
MDTERVHMATVAGVDQAPPIDAETISETIRSALCAGAGPIDLDEITALAETLRGHIALLLIEARQAAERVGRETFDAHQTATRLGSIEQQFRRPLAPCPLSAHVQVHQLARDCQWLLARHTAGPQR